MIIKLDLTKRQLRYIIAAMSLSLRTEDIKELVSNPETTWDFKARIIQEYAQRCELLAMLDKTFNYAKVDNHD